MARQTGRGLTGFFFREGVAGVAGVTLAVPSADGMAAATSLFSLDQFTGQGFNIGECVDRCPGLGVLSRLKLLDLFSVAILADPPHEHADPKSVVIPVVVRAMAVDAGNP